MNVEIHIYITKDEERSELEIFTEKELRAFSGVGEDKEREKSEDIVDEEQTSKETETSNTTSRGS